MKKLTNQEVMNLNGGCYSCYDGVTGKWRPVHTGCDGRVYSITGRPDLYALKCNDCRKYAVYDRATGEYMGYIKF